MSLEDFFRRSKATISRKEIGKLEEQIQLEFEKLCTYSNVFFDNTYRKAVKFCDVALFSRAFNSFDRYGPISAKTCWDSMRKISYCL